MHSQKQLVIYSFRLMFDLQQRKLGIQFVEVKKFVGKFQQSLPDKHPEYSQAVHSLQRIRRFQFPKQLALPLSDPFPLSYFGDKHRTASRRDICERKRKAENEHDSFGSDKVRWNGKLFNIQMDGDTLNFFEPFLSTGVKSSFQKEQKNLASLPTGIISARRYEAVHL